MAWDQEEAEVALLEFQVWGGHITLACQPSLCMCRWAVSSMFAILETKVVVLKALVEGLRMARGGGGLHECFCHSPTPQSTRQQICADIAHKYHDFVFEAECGVMLGVFERPSSALAWPLHVIEAVQAREW